MEFIFIQAIAGLSEAASLFLVAAGLTLLFGVARIVNFAHGSFYLLGAFLASFITSYLSQTFGLSSFWLAAFLAALITGVVGMVCEITILKRLYKSPELMQILATFAIGLVLNDRIMHYFGQTTAPLPEGIASYGSTRLINNFVPQYDFLLIFAAPIAYAALWLLLQKTTWGLRVRASINDRNMAVAIGIRQDLLFTSVMFLGCFLTGLGGALQLPKQEISLAMNYPILLQGFAVVIIGGLGSVTGAFLASILVAMVNAYLVYFFPELNGITPFILLALVLLIRPRGFFGLAANPLSGTIRSITELPKYPALLPGNILRYAITILTAFLIIYPFSTLIDPSYISSVNLVTEILIFMLFATSLQLLTGDGGMSSFGHASFFGIGAVSAALFYQYFSTDFFIKSIDAIMWPSLFLPAVMGALLGIITGGANRRLSGLYMAFFMLAFSQILYFATKYYLFNIGQTSFTGIWSAQTFSNPISFYYLTLTLVGFSIAGIFLLKYSPFGLILRACRDSQERAEAVGISVHKHRLIAHMTAGFFAALAGSLYSFYLGTIDASIFSFDYSLEALLILLLGGIHNIFGPIIGAFAYKFALFEAQTYSANWQLILGGILILLVVLLPHGIVGTLERLRLKKLRHRPKLTKQTRRI